MILPKTEYSRSAADERKFPDWSWLLLLLFVVFIALGPLYWPVMLRFLPGGKSDGEMLRAASLKGTASATPGSGIRTPSCRSCSRYFLVLRGASRQVSAICRAMHFLQGLDSSHVMWAFRQWLHALATFFLFTRRRLYAFFLRRSSVASFPVLPSVIFRPFLTPLGPF